MKAAVILFHKHSYKYNPQWIAKCLHSIKYQTYNKFDVFELDYGNEHTQLYSESSFASLLMADHAQAHNWLLDKIFELGYDCAFNINLDDVYALNRCEKQIIWIKAGYDVISSNFFHIDENGRVINSLVMDNKDFRKETMRNNNIIAHPVCCYSKNFWTNCTKLRSSEIPKDDFELWKRSYGKFKFKILPDFLLYYRVYKSKISAPGQWK